MTPCHRQPSPHGNSACFISAGVRKSICHGPAHWVSLLVSMGFQKEISIPVLCIPLLTLPEFPLTFLSGLQECYAAIVYISYGSAGSVLDYKDITKMFLWNSG